MVITAACMEDSCLSNLCHEHLIFFVDYDSVDYINLMCMGIVIQNTVTHYLSAFSSPNSALSSLSWTQQPGYTGASTLCRSLRWLTVHIKIQLKLIILTHKALHDPALPYISPLICVCHPTRALCSTNDLRIISFIIETSYYRLQNSACAAPVPWSALPWAMRWIPNINCLKLYNTSF